VLNNQGCQALHYGLLQNHKRDACGSVGDMKPSIDIATKIAQALEVSLDYLVGVSSVIVKDKQTLKRLADIDNLSDKDKEYIFYTLDNLIKAAKLNSL